MQIFSRSFKTILKREVRIINAYEALKLYAAAHPTENCVIRVEDDNDLPTNNAYYVMAQGKVRQTDEPKPEALRMNINQLAHFIFKDEEAEMNFMLN